MAAQLQRPIAEHLDGFIEHITARGRDDRYVRQLRPRLERFFDHAGIGRLVDVTADSLDKYVLHLRRDERSGYTVNEVIGTAKAFTKWAVSTRRLAIDPLACVRKLEAKKLTKTRARRALTAKEIAALLHAARQRIAQSHLRHTDPRLTANIYTDESILPVAASLAALPYLNIKAG
ncbi:MAG: hypothetical protein AB7G11_16670 [Phycisphaerales bacterium]